MMIILETIQLIVQTLFGLFALVLLLRFYLQLARAPFKHPLCQFVVAVTNFLVLPIRKVVPPVRQYDMASLLLAWLVLFLCNIIVVWLNSIPLVFSFPQVWVVLVLLSIVHVFKQSLILLMGAVIVQAIFSWVNPYNPLAPILDSLTRPFLRPFHKIQIANVDLSPLILFFIIQIILMIPIRWLEASFIAQIGVIM